MKLVPGQTVIINGKEFEGEVPDAYLKPGQKEKIEAGAKRHIGRTSEQVKSESAAKKSADAKAKAKAEAKEEGSGKG